VSLPTNDIKFNVTNGLAVGASGIQVINTSAEWVGNSGPGESPYGATGPDGVQGADGASGVNGASGVTGQDGATGIDGVRAEDGASGADGLQGATGPLGAIKLQHGYEWTNDQLQWRGNAYAGGASPGVSRLEFLQSDPIYSYLNAISPGTSLVIDWTGLTVATVTTIGTVQSPTAYTNGRHYLQISANPDGYSSGGYGSTNASDVLMIGTGPRNQGIRGIAGVDGSTGLTGVTGTDGASGITGASGAQGLDGATGATGIVGIDGATGVTGQDGATGVSGSRYHATSTTTLNLTTGATGAVLIEDELNYSSGQTILLADGGGKHIHATVDSYNSGTKVLAFTPIDHVGTGSSSSWEINLDGAEGRAGASGITGTNGDQGQIGSDGTQGSNFDSQGETGSNGDQGIDGSLGTQGSRGSNGSQGDQGIDGSLGTQGSNGTLGVRGVTGENGDQGVDGDQGTSGNNGTVGQDGATGAQGGDGSYGGGGGGTSYERSSNWSDVYWVDTALTSYTGHRIEYSHVTEPIGGLLNALSIGDTVTLRWNYSYGGGWTDQVLTVTEAWNSGNGAGLNASGYIKVNAGPLAYGAFSNPYLFSDTNGDVILLNSGSGPTNTGYTGSTGATGPQGDVGNQGYNADQLTTGNPRGAWDSEIEYYADDIVTYDGLSYRAKTTVTGFQPFYDYYWKETGFAGASGASGTNGASGITGTFGATGDVGTDGASGVTGDPGQQGILGTDADQLTYGNPRGVWDPYTTYFPDDIVVTGPPADSHRCLIENTGFYPDSSPTYWNTTAWAGASGVSGINGATGIDGASGVTGATGTDGATGSNGLRFHALADGTYSIQGVGTSTGVTLLPDSQSEDYSYSFAVGMYIVVARDVNNYMIGIVTAYNNTNGALSFDVTTSVGSGSGSGWIVNLDGAVGIAGATGVTGQDGATGATGVIGSQGDRGDTGLSGTYGVQGTTGRTGATGVKGDTGQNGLVGETGSDGVIGVTGLDGEQGETGATGATGVTGLKGFSLAQGSTGLTGTSQQTINIFAANEIGTAKYLVQGVDGSTNVQATEVILTQNGSGVYITEYATLKTGSKVMDVTASSDGSVISLRVTPTVSPTTFNWVRESIKGRIGGTTIEDITGTSFFFSYSHTDNPAIAVGKANLYFGTYWTNLINFTTLIGSSVTFDEAGVGPQSPAVGVVDSWDGTTLVVTISSGSFTNRTTLDKITYGY
jgi:hypothetical protein